MELEIISIFLHKKISENILFLVLWCVLIFLVFFSYYPSLYHVPRGDQITYLINNLDNHNFKEILSNSYSYTRSRQIDGGDYKLFRPVLHSILAFHKYFFETNFFIQQLCGILLHILVIFLLWIISIRLLNIIRPHSEAISLTEIPSVAQPVLSEREGLPRNDDLRHCERKKPSAPRRSRRGEAISGLLRRTFGPPRNDVILGMTWLKLIIFSLLAFVALNPVLIEQVIWTHIQGYLLFVILMLSSFYFLLKIDDNPKKYIFFIWSLLFIASFTYELGLLMTLLFGSYLFFSFRKTNLKLGISIFLLFSSIPIIYHIINWFDLNRHLEGPLQYYNWKEIFLTGPIMKTISNAIVLLGYTTLHPLIPSLARYSFGSRLVIGDLRGEGFNFYTILSIIMVAYLLFIVITRAKPLLKSASRSLISLLVVLLITYCGYLGIIIFGRLNSNIHSSLLTSSSYYAYMGFILFFLLIMPFLLIGFSKLKQWMVVSLIIMLWMINFDDSITLFKLNSGIRTTQSNLYSIVAGTRDFINDHSPTTSIHFDLENSDPVYSFHGVPFTTLIFRRYENSQNPDYIAVIKDGHVIFNKTEQYTINNLGYIIGPQLIKVGPVFNTYCYNNEYYALHHLEGFYSYNRSDYQTLLKASSLSEINERVYDHTHLKFDWLSLHGHEPIYMYDKNYKGYQLIRAFGLFYAIPSNAGPLDLFKIDNKISKKHYSSFFIKKSIDELKSIINTRGS